MSRPDAAAIRVLVIAHAIIGAALRLLIEASPGMVVVGTAENCSEAAAAAAGRRPEVILIALDGVCDLDLLPELLAAAGEAARVVMLAPAYDPAAYARAAMLGAGGVVFVGDPPRTLTMAIEKVHAGELWLNRSMAARVLAAASRSGKAGATAEEEVKAASLTEREREVVALLGEGLTNRQIADRLAISDKTVRNCLTSVYSKLEVSSRSELMIHAYRHGLAKLPH